MKSFDERLIAYRSAMALAATMLRRDIISAHDYKRIEDKIAEKYGFSSNSIYRGIA